MVNIEEGESMRLKRHLVDSCDNIFRLTKFCDTIRMANPTSLS